jgi:hypothetical protein
MISKDEISNDIIQKRNVLKKNLNFKIFDVI